MTAGAERYQEYLAVRIELPRLGEGAESRIVRVSTAIDQHPRITRFRAADLRRREVSGCGRSGTSRLPQREIVAGDFARAVRAEEPRLTKPDLVAGQQQIAARVFETAFSKVFLEHAFDAGGVILLGERAPDLIPPGHRERRLRKDSLPFRKIQLPQIARRVLRLAVRTWLGEPGRQYSAGGCSRDHIEKLRHALAGPLFDLHQHRCGNDAAKPPAVDRQNFCQPCHLTPPVLSVIRW